MIFALGATGLALVFDSAAGYAFAQLDFKGKNFLFVVVLLTMMVPFQVMMIPLFLESNYLGLLNTYMGLILPKATTAFGVFMMRSYFAQQPHELGEAARIDGLSEIGIFFRIFLPLVVPGLMTLGIFHLMNNWNDLLYPLMMTTETKMRTLSAGLALFVGERSTTYYGPSAGRCIDLHSAADGSVRFLPEVFHRQRGHQRNEGLIGMNQNLKNSAQALLAMQRMSWEQGVAAQAFFEYGRPDIGMLMVREALRRSDGKGLLGITNPAMDSVDCGANGLPLYYAYQYTGDRAYWAALQRLADWLEFSAPGAPPANCIITRAAGK